MYSSNMQQQLNQIFGLMGGFFSIFALSVSPNFSPFGQFGFTQKFGFSFRSFSFYILLVIMSGGLVLNNDGSETERFNCTTRSN